MKLISPWVNFYREIEALFAQDSEVRVVYDEEKTEVRLYVDNARKADAIAMLLPTEKTFGNVTLKISVVPADNGQMSKVAAIREAFFGNPALEYVMELPTPFGQMNYVVFQSKVVQYFNDDIGDLNGNRSTLYQELAKDVLGSEHDLYYCTEAVDKDLSKPLGEWP